MWTTATVLSGLCLIGALASIIASITIWYGAGLTVHTPIATAHIERLGIFVGLWAPTFFILRATVLIGTLKSTS